MRSEVLKDRAVIVSGGSRGIGSAIVRELVKHEVSVLFTYMNGQARARELLNDLKQESPDCRVVPVQSDIRSYKNAEALVKRTIDEFGRLDGLVNNAGIVRDKALMMMSETDWKDVIETNLGGSFNLARAAIVTFMKQRFGRIVNISSIAGIAGMPGQTNYSASKAGILGFTRALAREVASYNITVNAIAPGYIETDMTAGINEGKGREAILQRIPMRRMGKPDEIARIAALLLGDELSYVTGQVLIVDGGLILS